MKKLNPQIGEYSFDEWKELAKSNPQLFECEYSKAIDSYIESRPDDSQHKLRQLQFRVDGIRRKFKRNPYICAQELNQLMMNSLHDLNYLQQGLITGLVKIQKIDVSDKLSLKIVK